MVFLDVHARNISDDHPAVAILRDLETAVYYVDDSSSGSLARCIIQVILRWVDMLNSHLKVVRPMYCGFTFLTQRLRVSLSPSRTLI